MTGRKRFVYIGAGSFRFSIVLFSDFGRATELSPMDVWLVDIDEKSLNLMYKVFKNMAKKAKKKTGVDIRVFKTLSRREALENADFVYKSISVGIQEAEFFDNYIPIKYGIPQNTGDTVGPGGVFRALRTNKVSAEIARDMKELCPKATLLNYTNPQATIVMAARTYAPDIQFIGLCHELFGGMKSLKKWYNNKNKGNVKDWQDFEIEYGGVNHFAWLTKFAYNGEDLYPKLRKQAHDLVLEKFERPFNFYLLEKYGWFPYPGSRHVAEFLPDYFNYFNHEVQTPYWHFPVIRDVINLGRMRKAAYRVYKLIAKGLFVPKPRDLGEKAIDMTIDWLNNNTTEYVVNIPNNGIIPQLPEDSVVEVPAYFKDQKITPIHTINLPKEVADLVRPHAEQHRLTVNAALGNDMDLVIKAMLHDPMNKWIEDDDRIEFMTKVMLYYEQKWLPPEWKEWIPKKEELEKSKWWVSKKDLSLKNKQFKKKKFPVDERLRSKAFFWPPSSRP